MSPFESEFERGILALRLNRPDRLNALNSELIEALEAALERAADESVRVVTVTGAGSSFCSGADVDEVLTLGEEAATRFLRGLASALHRIADLGKPVVAGIQGHAAGGGAELALEADLRIAASDARLWFPDVGIGSSPASAWRLTRMVGQAKAAEMVMLGSALDAGDLRRAGVVTRVVEPHQLEGAVADLAVRLRDAAGKEPLRCAKQSLRLATEVDRATDLERNIPLMLACFSGEDQRRAVSEFAATDEADG